ncbi:unnamed protein product [Auanema sp. JU1783]|nr:unnamed protein product [Auanema sp. JU1783]
MSETSLAWWRHSPACYHEPKVHDHVLYFQLGSLNLYVLLPITLLGVFFNAIALIFLHRPPKITSGVIVYLRALLILDHCQLIITAATVLFPQVCDKHHSQNHTLYGFCMFERRFLKHTIPRIEATVNTMHVWTIAALSVHRYWKISRPVVSRLKDTTNKAHTMLLILFVIIMLFRLPTFLLELKFSWKPSFRVNKRIAATEVLSPYRLIYHSVLDPLLNNILPFMWMSLFSLLTLHEIFHTRHLTYLQVGTHARRNALNESLTPSYSRKTEILRHKQELRATISIVLIIILYLLLHSVTLFLVVRKWQMMIQRQCPNRYDYFNSHIAHILSLISASVNAFVFIAFTNHLKKYFRLFIRKASRTLSYSNEPSLSPKTTSTVVSSHHKNDMYL